VRDSPRVIGEVDTFAAPMLVHSEAVYIHDGQQYYVDKLDWEEKKAYVHPVSVEHYTDAGLAVRVDVIDQFTPGGPLLPKAHGEVLVSSLVTQYKKIRLHTHENLGWGEVHIPEQQMHTSAYWLTVPDELAGRVDGKQLPGAVTGLANVLGNIAPLYLMCDPRDLGVYAQARSPFTGRATVFIYDKVPGGIGFSEYLFDVHDRLLTSARDHVAACPCAAGCPSCVGVGPGDDGSSSLTKASTRLLLESLTTGVMVSGD
jgi:DEAD/DEAH box helicase domain-containing protein